MIELRIDAEGVTRAKKASHGLTSFQTSLQTGTKMEHYGEVMGLALNALRNQITTTKQKRDVNAFIEALKAQLDPAHFHGLDGHADYEETRPNRTVQDEALKVLPS